MRHQDLYDLNKELLILTKKGSDISLTNNTALLLDRLTLPSAWIALVGETSTGKTTLINSFLGGFILPISSAPTTGTVVQIICDSSVPEPKFCAIRQNGDSVGVTLEEFNRMIIAPDSDISRLQLTTNIKGSSWDDFQIIDSPGYNSQNEDHNKILSDFIPNCNAIILTVGYRTGFGQSDYDLYQLIHNSLDDEDVTVPVILLINRITKPINAKRIEEITNRASDAINRKLEVMLVDSAPPDQQNRRTLPATSHLWDKIYEYGLSPEVVSFFRANILKSLLHLNEQAIISTQTLIAASKSSLEEVSSVESELKSLYNNCHDLINNTFDSIDNKVPSLVKFYLDDIKSKAYQYIESASDWQDSESCVNYVCSHIYEFGMKSAIMNINKSIAADLEQLNKILLELVNSTIHKLNDMPKINMDDKYDDLAVNVSLAIGQRLVSSTALNAVKGIGGIGGAAAGTGNLVKMGLKRFGNLFGKTFSKEVYASIGRFFTKRMVQSLTLALSALVEAALFVYESKTWKGKLIVNVDSTISSSEDELTNKLSTDILKVLRQENLDQVKLLLKDQIDELASLRLSGRPTQEKIDELEKNLNALKTLKQKIQLVTS